jgi:hypothetical protein
VGVEELQAKEGLTFGDVVSPVAYCHKRLGGLTPTAYVQQLTARTKAAKANRRILEQSCYSTRRGITPTTRDNDYLVSGYSESLGAPVRGGT